MAGPARSDETGDAETTGPTAASVFTGASEMAQRGRAIDWSSTPLGPVEDWPEALCAVVRLMLAVANVAVESTERVRAESALVDERARLEQLFRRAPSFIAAYRGEDFVFEFANEAYYQIVGRRDLLGRALVDAIPEVRDQGFVELLRQVLTTGDGWVGRETPVALRRTRGAPSETRYVDMVLQPIVEADGTRSGVVAHGSDVTEQVRAKREIERLLADSERARRAAEVAWRDVDAARAEAERQRSLADAARHTAEDADRAKSEFLATISHEIRTPINAILGYGELLDLEIAGPMTSQQRDYLARLRASGQHLLGLISDVLDLAKVDAGRMPIAREQAMTGEIVQSAVALALPGAHAKGIRLIDEQAGEAGVAYAGDAPRVRQILVNLLTNAVKFTAAGGTVRIVSGRRIEPPADTGLDGTGWTYVSVTDSGIGIAPEQAERIFEPFVQGEGGHTRTAGGTGLGLAISRRLAQLMDGALLLERSALGEGSVFTLWLPALAGAAGRSAAPPARAEPHEARKRDVWTSEEIAAIRFSGLADAGAQLRRGCARVLAAYVTRLRDDPLIPDAEQCDRADLEDHAATLISNLAQSLTLIERQHGVDTQLLKDAGEIQRVVADLHGRQRRRLGWSEAALLRDYELLADEMVADLAHVEPPIDADLVVAVLRRLLGRAAETSARAFRHAQPPDES